jgi:hypothetical protein
MSSLKIDLERPIAFYPQLARVLGSIEAALFWQQCYYWRDKTKRSDGFFYKTIKEFEQETTLSPHWQRKVRKQLISLGVLEEKKIKANGAPTMHFKVNAEAMQKLLDSFILESEPRSQSKVNHVNNPITETTTETVPKGTASAEKHKKPKKHKNEEGSSFGEEEAIDHAGVVDETSVMALMYRVKKKYKLTSYNQGKDYIGKFADQLVDEQGEEVARLMLTRLLERDLAAERRESEFVPLLSTIPKLVYDAPKIIDYLRRTKSKTTTVTKEKENDYYRRLEEQAEQIRNS